MVKPNRVVKAMRKRLRNVRSLSDDRAYKLRKSFLLLVLAAVALHYLDILVLHDTYLGVSQLAALPAAAVAGLIAAGQGVMNWLQSRSNTNLTNRGNMKLARYQYSKDLEMWNRQNEYNAPTAQMERLQAAGLNPNLVYTSGNAPGLTSGQMPRYNAPTLQYNYEPLNVAGMIGQYQDLMMKQAQTDNLKAQNDAIRQNTVKSEWATKLLAYQGSLAESKTRFAATQEEYKTMRMLQDLEQKKEMFPYSLEYMKGKTKAVDTSIQKMMTDMQKTMADTEMQKLRSEWYVTQLLAKMGTDIARTIGNFSPLKKLPKFGTTGSFNQRTAERRFEETTRRMRQFGQ